MFDPGVQNLWAKKVTSYILIKLAKKIGDFEFHFFSKVDSNRFFLQQQNTQKSKKNYKIGNVRKWSKIYFREKVHLKDHYFLPVLGGRLL